MYIYDLPTFVCPSRVGAGNPGSGNSTRLSFTQSYLLSTCYPRCHNRRELAIRTHGLLYCLNSNPWVRTASQPTTHRVLGLSGRSYPIKCPAGPALRLEPSVLATARTRAVSSRSIGHKPGHCSASSWAGAGSRQPLSGGRLPNTHRHEDGYLADVAWR